MILRTTLGLLLLCLAGCAAGLDRNLVRYQLENSSLQITDETTETIEEVKALRPQLMFPCKLAVYLHPPGYSEWQWTSGDKRIFDAWGKELKRQGVVREAFFLPNMLLGEKKDLHALRLAAAKCGADALLVVQGAVATDDYMNPAAAANLTVVGGFVVPGSHCDALFVAQALLIDVNNGFIYATAEGEGKGSVIRPSFIIEQSGAINNAKKRALHDLGPRVATQMQKLKGSIHVPLGFRDYNPTIGKVSTK